MSYFLRKAALIPTLALMLGCGSAQSRPSTIARPEIEVRQAGSLFFGSGSEAPITFEITISNPSNVPLTFTEIEVSSFGNAQFELRRRTHRFRETILPGQFRTVSVFATAVRQTSRATPTEPPSVRLIVRFEAPGGILFREIVNEVMVQGTE